MQPRSSGESESVMFDMDTYAKHCIEKKEDENTRTAK